MVRTGRWARRLIADVFSVCRGIHECARLRRLGSLEDDHPSLAVRILVHELGLVDEGFVDIDDLSAERCENLADGLHRLDGTDRLSLLDGLPDGRQLDVHDVRQLVLCKIRNPNPGALALDLRPLMVLRVAEPFRDVRQIDPNQKASMRPCGYESFARPHTPLDGPGPAE